VKIRRKRRAEQRHEDFSDCNFAYKCRLPAELCQICLVEEKLYWRTGDDLFDAYVHRLSRIYHVQTVTVSGGQLYLTDYKAWTQSSWYDEGPCSLMLSVADVRPLACHLSASSDLFISTARNTE
jgi:hypothetical protein